MTEAEVLQSAMTTKETTNSQNIDLQPFFLRNVLGARLRAENPGKIPILLYWHPNIDHCASVCKINGLAATQSKVSIMGRIKSALGVGGITPANEAAAAKLLVSSTETLHYIEEHHIKTLQKNIISHIEKLFQSNWFKNWEERRLEITEKLPKWDAHDLQTVIAFYILSGDNSIVLHSYSRCDRIDASHRGDDGLLRLFISFEFRRGLRDKMIEQQRNINYVIKVDQQKKVEEQKRIEEQRKEEQRKEEQEEMWEYDKEDVARTEVIEVEQNDASILQRAGGSIVNGVQATGGLVVGGASMIVGGAWTGVNMVGSVASGSADTLTNLFRREPLKK